LTQNKFIGIIMHTSTTVTDQWFDIDSFQVYRITDRVEHYQIADQDGIVETLEGPVKYAAGCFILRGPKGERYPTRPEKFHELKHDLGNGLCKPKKIIKLAKIADHSGIVDTSWGELLHYNPNVDIIVKHGPGDYGVVKVDIFEITYERI
jgi:hypothetical protein